MFNKVAVYALVPLLILAGCAARTGLDNACIRDFEMFRGKSVGVVANHTSLDRKGRHIVDLLKANEELTLRAILAPEHGYRGNVERGENIATQTDPVTGVPIYSIYGNTRKPTPDMLQGLDVLIFDIQDIGARFYTYISTMGNAMEAAAELELHVLECSGWNPDKPYERTRLPWIATSPNIMNINQALCYPGTCLFEGANFSEGRGTLHPFEWIGASWLDPEKLIAELENRNIQGVKMKALVFIPEDIPGTAMNPKFEGEPCRGLSLTISDPVHFESVTFGVHLFTALFKLHPEHFEIDRPDFLAQLWGNPLLETMILEGKQADTIITAYKDELEQFIRLRENYLLY